VRYSCGWACCSRVWNKIIVVSGCEVVGLVVMCVDAVSFGVGGGISRINSRWVELGLGSVGNVEYVVGLCWGLRCDVICFVRTGSVW